MIEDKKQLLKKVLLFIVTIIVTTIAGAEWVRSKFVFYVPEEYQMSWDDFLYGFNYSIPFLLILTFHEFGHYFTARYHKIRVSLPNYIPLWLGFLPGFPSFGTMGAFIRIKDIILSRKHYFDVGVSGPLAGFVVALAVIIYGYTHLPEPEYVFEIHPEYEQFGLDYADHVYDYAFNRQQDSLAYMARVAKDSIAFYADGGTGEWTYKPFEAQASYSGMSLNKPLLFVLAERYLVEDESRIPNVHEIMHYPYLLAGLLALFFTALNLLPIGQLDGGHIVFGVFGSKRSKQISRVLFMAFLFYAGLGIVNTNFIDFESLLGLAVSLFWFGVYIYYLYSCTESLFEKKIDKLTFAVVMMGAQFAVHIATGWTGNEGWLLFGLILGRFIGVEHPGVIDERPLSLWQKSLAVMALIVFILSFSPAPFQF